jgi:hypothetical protein
MYELLLIGGLTVAAASVAIGIVFAIALWLSKRRLNAKLDSEYGTRK